MEKIVIQNIVASSSFEITLDLTAIDQELENTDYRPDKFPGLIFRLNKPKCTLLIFRNGKIVCTGAKNVEEVHKAVGILANSLAKLDYSVERSPKILIQNFVATYDLGFKLNLTRTALELGLEQVEYEPELFPGLVYRMREPKVVLLLFAPGKVVITGGKSVKEVKQAGKKLHGLLVNTGLISG